MYLNIGIVATSPVVLRWLCDSPRTGCAWRTTPYKNVARTSNNSDHGMWTLLLLAATVRSFAHMPLGISDRNRIISTRKIYQSMEFQFYIVICLDRGTDLNRLLISYWLLLRFKIKIWGLCERCNMSRNV